MTPLNSRSPTPPDPSRPLPDADYRLLREALEENERFREGFQRAPVGIVFLDPESRFHYVNPAFCTMLGYGEGELRGEDFLHYMVPEDRQEKRHVIRLLLRGEIQSFTSDKRLVRRDGKVIWTRMQCSLVPAREGKPRNLVATVQDISAQKEWQEQLEASERRYRLLNNLIPQLVWIGEADGALSEVNDRWISYIGLTRQEAVGYAWRKQVHADDLERTLQAWQEAYRSRTEFVVEHRLMQREDGYRWFLTRAVPILDDEGRIVQWFGTSTDIDLQKHALEMLLRERDLRDQFIGIVSHDLRNPLTTAQICAQLLLHQVGAPSGPQPELLQNLANRIVESVARINQMIEDLLDSSRIRAGKRLPVKPQQFDLPWLVRSVVEELARVHGPRFRVECPPVLPVRLSLSGIRRMLENLLSNAVKYGSDVDPVTVRLERLEGSACERLRLSVHNLGNPIPPQELGRIFDPFARARSAEQGTQRGWGLGLTLVKGVAESHGGRVVVSSGASGTIFAAELPLELGESGSPAIVPRSVPSEGEDADEPNAA